MTRCPSHAWDVYYSEQEGDDTRCATCGCDLPEQDPDPENTGASPWWDGYCSEVCREKNAIPSEVMSLGKHPPGGGVTS